MNNSSKLLVRAFGFFLLSGGCAYIAWQLPTNSGIEAFFGVFSVLFGVGFFIHSIIYFAVLVEEI